MQGVLWTSEVFRLARRQVEREYKANEMSVGGVTLNSYDIICIV